jgi:hypothetical protein
MSDPLISCAALYFGSDNCQSVPLFWLNAAFDSFKSVNVSLDYFSVIGTTLFSPDETYDLSQYKNRLLQAVAEGVVRDIGLYCNPDPNTPRSAWRAMASVEIATGVLFVGMDQAQFPDQVWLLRFAYSLAGHVLGVRYGISYNEHLARGPDGYALGMSYLLSLGQIRHRLHGLEQEDRQLNVWRNEIQGQRRYLTGLFRGVYPASIISSSHLTNLRATFAGKPIPGNLEALLDKEVWVWTLSDAEVGVVSHVLRSRCLVVE